MNARRWENVKTDIYGKAYLYNRMIDILPVLCWTLDGFPNMFENTGIMTSSTRGSTGVVEL